MIINNTFNLSIEDPFGKDDQYVFNLKNCMYMARNTPKCLRFVFGTHNLVIHFTTLEAVEKYFTVFMDYFEGKVSSVEIEDSDLENCELEVKE